MSGSSPEMPIFSGPVLGVHAHLVTSEISVSSAKCLLLFCYFLLIFVIVC